jgi:ubiquinone/menaquinone biosynthesis C-methylase UbiE
MKVSEQEQGYDGIAEWYDQCVRAHTMLHDTVIQTLLSLAGDVTGLDLCDLACGQGVIAREVGKRGAATVCGIDLSLKLLAIARDEERRKPLGLVYIHEDAQSLSSISDDLFDGVLCNLALMDIEDLPATARTIQRILRAGGWVAFSITHPCAPVTSVEGTLQQRPYSYFEEGLWFSQNPLSVRGRVGSYHRTLSTYLRCFLEVGLKLEQIIEPQATGPITERIPGYTTVPVALVARFRKEALTLRPY